jgi:hypothetical protein
MTLHSVDDTRHKDYYPQGSGKNLKWNERIKTYTHTYTHTQHRQCMKSAIRRYLYILQVFAQMPLL